MSEIYNLSISPGVFSDACKVAKLKPIYKKGKKSDPSNYRPISLFPIMSKVIQRIVHDQTNTFLSENNILYNFRSGFRPGYLLIFKEHLTQKHKSIKFSENVFSGLGPIFV